MMKNKIIEKLKSLEPIGFFVFLSIVFTIFTILMFVFFAFNLKEYKIFNKQIVVYATVVDVEPTSMTTVPIEYTYKPFTLVFKYEDENGNVYRGTERKYDTEKLARQHLGEKVKIRIDGNGNFIEGNVENVEPYGYLIAACVLLVAIALCVIFGIFFTDGTRYFFAKVWGGIQGNNRPFATLIVFILFIFLLGAGSGFFLSGLNGIMQVDARREFIISAKRVDATFVSLNSVRSSGRNHGSSHIGYNYTFEYIDFDNELIYSGTADFIPDSISAQELLESHRAHIGKKVKILIDGKGNCMLASETAEQPIDNAYYWVGICIYIADFGLLIAFLMLRFIKVNKKEDE